ncbi:MAG TPA: MarR family transcriptional regulator [Steroidobacteraceae bacterium]|jgi:DNA-binding MarR family transcriptional regulator|nr:MarR family transcriptional regulator [Steroidobacteraceae bacterium]
MPREKSALLAVPAALDAETRVHDDHHVSLRLWLRLLSCTNQIECRVRQGLQSSFDTTLPRFDLMAQLERAPRGLKMSELSQRMMVTGGNVTGITDGLEKEGLVVREVDSADRRVYRVKLTAEGERQFRRMAAEHESWVIDLFGALSPKQKKQLMDLLGELKEYLAGLNGVSAGEKP